MSQVEDVRLGLEMNAAEFEFLDLSTKQTLEAIKGENKKKAKSMEQFTVLETQMKKQN